MDIRQLAVGGLDRNFSYLLYDKKSREAALVDPGGDARVIEKAVRERGMLKPKYILLTHGHYDHCSGVREVKRFFAAPVAAHPACAFPHDIDLGDQQALPLGNLAVECIYAPGHSGDSVVFRLSDDSALFTGDTLFIDWCGYCDAGAMFRTMRTIIYPLPDSLEVYPGHDYGRSPHAALGTEKRENPYLATANYERFCEELKNL